jgi:hypothetical protein
MFAANLLIAGLTRIECNGGRAVSFSKSTLTDVTPDIFSGAFLTVIGRTEQVMFFTSRVTFSEVPVNRLKTGTKCRGGLGSRAETFGLGRGRRPAERIS